jgi:hypothetical protein
MIEVRDGQHRGVVAYALLKTVPLSAKSLFVVGITFKVPIRWSSVTMRRMFGRRDASWLRSRPPAGVVPDRSASAARQTVADRAMKLDLLRVVARMMMNQTLSDESDVVNTSSYVGDVPRTA